MQAGLIAAHPLPVDISWEMPAEVIPVSAHCNLPPIQEKGDRGKKADVAQHANRGRAQISNANSFSLTKRW